MTENELRERAAAQARDWLGRRESDGSHREIVDIYNRIRPLPRGYRLRYSDPWCAAFVSAVGAAVGLTDTLLPECSCEHMIALYKKAGRWTEDDAYEARTGDLIFYDWQDGGAGDAAGTADHVGLITDYSGGVYRAVEGNVGDAVERREIRRNAKTIRGFARPDYAAKAADETLEDEIQAGETKDEDRFTLRFRILRYGDMGEDVRALQRELKALGFDVGRWGLDGEFGYDTKNAVAAYQRSVGLEADGEVGPLTEARLLGIKA